METYIAVLTAKHGHANELAEFYKSMEDELKAAPGFISRKIYVADKGRMVKAILDVYAEDELPRKPEPPSAESGTQIVLIEEWESAEHRICFAKQTAPERKMAVVPLMLPEHSHEFFFDATPEQD